jgi:superfamily II DNA/RNA helicase
LIHKIMKELDWNNCVNRRGQDGSYVTESAPTTLFNGNIFKLHGNMDHADRKSTYFGFDKNEHCVLVCTDVASRGLDFKNVGWIVHFDLSSQFKEYVNRVGRTARIASSGQSLCLVLPTEIEYVSHMKKSYQVEMTSKSRFTLVKLFE